MNERKISKVRILKLAELTIRSRKIFSYGGILSTFKYPVSKTTHLKLLIIDIPVASIQIPAES